MRNLTFSFFFCTVVYRWRCKSPSLTKYYSPQDKQVTLCTNTFRTARWMRCCRTCPGEQVKTALSSSSWRRRRNCWSVSCGGASNTGSCFTTRKGITRPLVLSPSDEWGMAVCCCGIKHIYTCFTHQFIYFTVFLNHNYFTRYYSWRKLISVALYRRYYYFILFIYFFSLAGLFEAEFY